MKLRHITFTGIDARTDLQELRNIQRQYPIAEFGVLTSYHWYENGNRYLNPQFLCNFWGQGLNLALHICGLAAHDAADGNWYAIDSHTIQCLGLFRRVQLNVANRTDTPFRLTCAPDGNTEVIIQQKGKHEIKFFQRSQWVGTVSVLLDASGGQGIDTPIDVLPNKFDNGVSCFKVGYAGGINPDNVADKLAFLMENEDVGDFWIDMESGVRTDDWFDISKVRKVLEICEPIIKKYEDD